MICEPMTCPAYNWLKQLTRHDNHPCASWTRPNSMNAFATYALLSRKDTPAAGQHISTY